MLSAQFPDCGKIKNVRQKNISAKFNILQILNSPA